MLAPLSHLRNAAAVPLRVLKSPIPSRTRFAYVHIYAYNHARTRRPYSKNSAPPQVGTTTPVPDDFSPPSSTTSSPFYFEAGYALYAKRPSRPFPPPFLSLPSHSFSEPLSTHHRSRDRRTYVDGEMIRGVTNGDDAVLVSERFIAANDGVGAWGTRERGHAALWSRLIIHFWALEIERSEEATPNPVSALQTAYERTKAATSDPNEWFGTTTACSALLSSAPSPSASPSDPPSDPSCPTQPLHPTLSITQLGDSQVLVVRPRTKAVIFKTVEQWHWFDCPRQLGTNSPDTPTQNAVLDIIDIEEDDVVLAMTDGVVDNLWEHEIVTNVLDSMTRWAGGNTESENESGKEPAEYTYADGMRYVAQELVNAARVIAEDPFAESPYMEKAIDEGLSIEGGM
ncbi:hypothetical protein P154DRAFT_173262 [Amniculicola lignicola CBS 123094]|uniref:Protein phosphatase n=1 Tax=Amniculicola lignicola CBS 123094 TaxID=1392246 RepID=A0A6A5WUA5_9PLEO|nr:hypothetical protein P154DRAFT_173262 [Amniculicola lignicola CBS 123094]